METTNCIICKKDFKGHGNNPQPLSETGECCDTCNYKFVIPARMEDLWKEHSQHQTPLPSRCSECYKEERRWKENPFVKGWKAKNDAKIKQEKREQQELDQLTEDKLRAEAEDCDRDYDSYFERSNYENNNDKE